MVAQLLIEVKDVPMRVALAQNGDKAENVRMQPKTFAVGLDQSLRRQLGRAIHRRLHGGAVVITHDLVVVLQQAIDQVAANKARTPCDKILQTSTSLYTALWRGVTLSADQRAVSTRPRCANDSPNCHRPMTPSSVV